MNWTLGPVSVLFDLLSICILLRSDNQNQHITDMKFAGFKDMVCFFFLSQPPFGEGISTFVRVRLFCMYVCILSSLRRCWLKSNIQFMKST